MNWYVEVLKKYAVFSGRARRKEYWMFTLINVLIIVALAMINAVMQGNSGQPSVSPATVVLVLYYLAILIPALGVTIRRLHDTGRSGWWFLIAFVPLIGSLVLLVFMVSDSQAGTNQYGPNLKKSQYNRLMREF